MFAGLVEFLMKLCVKIIHHPDDHRRCVYILFGQPFIPLQQMVNRGNKGFYGETKGTELRHYFKKRPVDSRRSRHRQEVSLNLNGHPDFIYDVF